MNSFHRGTDSGKTTIDFGEMGKESTFASFVSGRVSTNENHRDHSRQTRLQREHIFINFNCLYERVSGVNEQCE